MMGFYVADQYKRDLKKYISKNLDPKYYSCSDRSFSNNMIEELKSLMKLIRLQKNRITMIIMILIDEIDYLRENKDKIEKSNEYTTSCYCMFRTLKNIKESVYTEFEHKYAWHS